MLQIISLCKSFGPQRVLSGVDLTIAAGEFFALLGASGCGKTTLLRILGGLDRADSGELRLDGERIDLVPPHRRPCHMVFQRYALFPHLDVRGNVGFALQLQGLSRAQIDERVAEILALVEMQGMEQRRIQTLSGGQQQRIALARALASRPRYLLLDEPLSALDLKLRQRMQLELRALQQRLGITFIFVTHDQEEALTLADRVAVMRAGQVEQIGTPAELYHRPQTAYVASFIGQINTLDGILLSKNIAEVAGIGLVPITDCSSAIGKPVRVMVRPEDLRLESTSESLPSASHATISAVIEHVFFKGPYCEAVVRGSFAKPSMLTLHLPTAAASALHVGDKVSIAWPQDKAIAFAESATCP